MKNITIKLFKKTSREIIPVSYLKGKIMLSKKKELIERAVKRNSMGGHFNND